MVPDAVNHAIRAKMHSSAGPGRRVTRDAFSYRDSDPVRGTCQACWFFRPEEGRCGLFLHLNQRMPNIFDLQERVKSLGGCNAQRPKHGR